MRTILIVDDDYIARSKISSLLDWQKNGYMIVNEAASGNEALKMMEQELPQIALVDMDMPVMNGVELIREMNRRKYQISVIVLSSYNDFQYVRESMKLGALDYILKSELDAEQMLRALSGAENIRNREDAGRLTMKDKEYIRELYVKRILLNRTTDEKENERWIDNYNLQIDSARNMLALVEIDDYWIALEELDEKGIFMFHQFIENLFRETVQKIKGMTAVKMRENQFCLILSCKELYSIGSAQGMLNAVIAEVRRNLKRFLNMTASVSIGSICLGLGELAECYKKTEDSLKQKLYFGKGQIFYGERSEPCLECGLEEKLGHTIGRLFFVSDSDEMERQVHRIFEMIAESRMPEKKARNFAAEILRAANAEARRYKLDFKALCGTAEPFEKLRYYETLKDMEVWILKVCRAFTDLVKPGGGSSHYSKLTVNAIAYLSEHYRDAISLSDTADYLGVSSSHLSRVFKNDTGMNLVNYLNQIRIEKAKKMIAENDFLQMKNIAYETGFNSYNHFSATFKSVVGMSPQEYQERKEKRQDR